jgi:hypothetical protein
MTKCCIHVNQYVAFTNTAMSMMITMARVKKISRSLCNSDVARKIHDRWSSYVHYKVVKGIMTSLPGHESRTHSSTPSW